MSDKARELASDLRTCLNSHRGMVKEAELKEKRALDKLAGVEAENRILNETLDLVSKGVIDPFDAMDRVEEFRQDPQQIEVIKAAYELGFDSVPSVGTPVQNDKATSDKSNPIEKALIDLEPTLRGKW